MLQQEVSYMADNERLAGRRYVDMLRAAAQVSSFRNDVSKTRGDRRGGDEVQ